MNRLLAAFIFFTRLPFWRMKEVPSECYKKVVVYWPLTGWLTGGVTVLTAFLAMQIFPVAIAWILAIMARLLVTGCLHEDGLADFIDGFGGGSQRERILSIMKDSHIGTYGVIGLICYFLLLTKCDRLIEANLAFVFCADCWSKTVSSQLINLLPYARKAEEAKIQVIYDRMNRNELFLNLCCGLIPCLLLLPLKGGLIVLLCPVLVFGICYLIIKRRLGGYTGDCCGATFLLCELSFLLSSLYINFY